MKQLENHVDSLVINLISLPKKILKYRELEELPQIVLHDISQEKCFNFDKSAYFVDNPDFDHLQGIAAYSKDDFALYDHALWDNPYKFKDVIHDGKFISTVKKYLDSSLIRKKVDIYNSKDVADIGRYVGMHNPDFLMWDMLHGNHGLLIFDSINPLSKQRKNLLAEFAPLLSFCPIHKY